MRAIVAILVLAFCTWYVLGMVADTLRTVLH